MIDDKQIEILQGKHSGSNITERREPIKGNTQYWPTYTEDQSIFQDITGLTVCEETTTPFRKHRHLNMMNIGAFIINAYENPEKKVDELRESLLCIPRLAFNRLLLEFPILKKVFDEAIRTREYEHAKTEYFNAYKVISPDICTQKRDPETGEVFQELTKTGVTYLKDKTNHQEKILDRLEKGMDKGFKGINSSLNIGVGREGKVSLTLEFLTTPLIEIGRIVDKEIG
jgi:hypothetical protein